ncbi:MAG: hypothetical protein JJE48_02630 [Actinobacteria bacterium]|nr:hypothetical protein [Actinomycetota bacterium]
MRRFAAVLIVCLLLAGLMAAVGCGGNEPEIEGKYLDPQGGTLELKADGTMSVTRLPGASTTEGTYKVEKNELRLYGPDANHDDPMMTFEIKDGELIDVTGLIWIKQPKK